MGWHDALAARSAEQGKTSADFRVGARRKAKATILFLLLAGVVGYLAGWPWALLPGVLAAWSGFQSRSALMIASRLEAMEAQPPSVIAPYLGRVATGHGLLPAAKRSNAEV